MALSPPIAASPEVQGTWRRTPYDFIWSSRTPTRHIHCVCQVLCYAHVPMHECPDARW